MKKVTKPITARMNIEEFAKLRDCLIAKGISPDKLMTNSNIAKIAMLLIIVDSPEPTSPASKESLDIISQIWQATPRAKKIKMDDLY